MTVNLPAAGKLRRDEWGIPLTQQCNDHDDFISTFRTINRLTADTTPANNNTVLATIAGLTTPLLASTAYLFELYVVYLTNATADLKLAWSLPAGAVADFGIDYWDSATAKQSAQSSTPPSAHVSGGFASPLYARFFGSLQTSTTPGNFTVQFAQNVANVSNTTVNRGSYLKLERVPS